MAKMRSLPSLALLPAALLTCCRSNLLRLPVLLAITASNSLHLLLLAVLPLQVRPHRVRPLLPAHQLTGLARATQKFTPRQPRTDCRSRLSTMAVPAAALANASAASRMSEEAVDLICSFIRDMESPGEYAPRVVWPSNGRLADCASADSTSTLRALMLTSRQFVSSARRALLFDPTRHLGLDWYRFSTLAFQVWQDPHLGLYIKRLDNLASIIEDVLHMHDYEMTAENQLLLAAFLRHCVDLRSIAVPADLPSPWARWMQELASNPSLSQLICSSLDPEGDYQYDTLVELLRDFLPPSVSTLRFEHALWYTEDWFNHRALTLAVTELSIFACEVWDEQEWRSLAISCPYLRRLDFRPSAAPYDLPLGLFPPTLEVLHIGPAWPAPHPRWWDWDGRYGRWRLPLEFLPRLPRLRSIELAHAWLCAGDIPMLASACPALQTIRLTSSTWRNDEWEVGIMSDQQLVASLSLFPFLRHVDLGYLPHPAHSSWRLVPLTRRYCRERNIDIQYARLSELEDAIEVDVTSVDYSDSASPMSFPLAAWPTWSRRGSVSVASADEEPSPSSPASEASSYLERPLSPATSSSDGDDDRDVVPPDWGFHSVGPADFAATHPPSSPSYRPPSPREEQIHCDEARKTGWDVEESSQDEEDEMQVDWSGSSDGEDADRAWREFEGAFDDLDAPM